MNWQPLIVFSALACLCMSGNLQAQSGDYFSEFYGGLEVGAISYNTQITFDGVDDPAGRGGFGYGLFLGYNHSLKKWLIGVEFSFNLASKPGPYTFDPAVTGFAELDLQRGASAGLDLRVGYLVIKRLLIFGSAGYSANKQSVEIDGLPLEQFAGGAAPKIFGALQYGIGFEIAVNPKLSIRSSFRALAGHDLSAADFGTIPADASLTFFDVEPGQHHFFSGLVFRF